MPAFGQTECPEYTFAKIADTATPVAGGNGGTFEGLSLSEPAVTSLSVAFYGEGGGAEGIFVGDGKTLNSVAAVGDPLAGGGTIDTIVEDFAFSGGVFDIIINTPSSGNHGIYTADGSGLSKIVEFGESAPGGGTFSTLRFVSRQAVNLAFWVNIFEFGMPARSNGVFTRIAGVNELVADTTTVIPGSEPTTFSGFSDPDISGQNVATDGGEVAFSGAGSGFIGLFVSGQFSLCRVIDTNDTLEGKNVTQVFMGRDSYSVVMLSFRAVFSDGSQAIYLANAPRISPTGAFPTGALFLLLDEWG